MYALIKDIFSFVAKKEKKEAYLTIGVFTTHVCHGPYWLIISHTCPCSGLLGNCVWLAFVVVRPLIDAALMSARGTASTALLQSSHMLLLSTAMKKQMSDTLSVAFD